MVTYSPPYRLFLVKDPETGRRQQLHDEAEARQAAKDIARRTGGRLRAILVPSRCFYVLEYSRGSSRGQRVNTKKKTKFEAQEWVRERIRAARGPYCGAHQTLKLAVDEWIDELRMLRRSEKTLTNYRSQLRRPRQELRS